MTLGEGQDSHRVMVDESFNQYFSDCDNHNVVKVPIARLHSMCPSDDFDEVDGSRGKLEREEAFEVTSDHDDERDVLPAQRDLDPLDDEEKRHTHVDKTTTRQESSWSMTRTTKMFNANTYASKKTITQGLFDIALLTANTSYMKLLCQQYIDGNPPNFFFFLVILLALSIVLQIAVGILLFFKIRFNITKEHHQQQAELCNNIATVMVMVITVVNVIIASFSNYTSLSIDKVDGEKN